MRALYAQENEKNKSKKQKDNIIKIIYDADYPALMDKEIDELDRLKQFEKHFPFYRMSFNSMV